jgi:predicted ABC-type ATPase
MATNASSRVVLIAGPHGAGKSTVAPEIVRTAFGIEEFVNADAIATGLSGFAPERVAIRAGRLMWHGFGSSPRLAKICLRNHPHEPYLPACARTSGSH